MAERNKDRFPPIPPEKWSAEQKRAVDEMLAGPRKTFGGPFVPLLRSPELMTLVQRLGAFIRYDSSVPHKLREFAMAITALHWQQGLEWGTHAPLAQKLGVDAGAMALLGKGEVPKPLKDDEQTVYEFCTALHRDQRVNDAVYAKTLALLGEAGTVELTALCGYYALLAMMMNMAQTPTPPGITSPF